MNVVFILIKGVPMAFLRIIMALQAAVIICGPILLFAEFMAEAPDNMLGYTFLFWAVCGVTFGLESLLLIKFKIDNWPDMVRY